MSTQQSHGLIWGLNSLPLYFFFKITIEVLKYGTPYSIKFWKFGTPNFMTRNYCPKKKQFTCFFFFLCFCFFFCVMRLKESDWKENSKHPDQNAPSESDIGLHCLLMPICLNIQNFYGVVQKVCHLQSWNIYNFLMHIIYLISQSKRLCLIAGSISCISRS